MFPREVPAYKNPSEEKKQVLKRSVWSLEAVCISSWRRDFKRKSFPSFVTVAENPPWQEELLTQYCIFGKIFSTFTPSSSERTARLLVVPT